MDREFMKECYDLKYKYTFLVCAVEMKKRY